MLPDEEAWENDYVQVVFDGEPTADVSHLRGLPPAQRRAFAGARVPSTPPAPPPPFSHSRLPGGLLLTLAPACRGLVLECSACIVGNLSQEVGAVLQQSDLAAPQHEQARFARGRGAGRRRPGASAGADGAAGLARVRRGDADEVVQDDGGRRQCGLPGPADALCCPARRRGPFRVPPPPPRFMLEARKLANESEKALLICACISRTPAVFQVSNAETSHRPCYIRVGT